MEITYLFRDKGNGGVYHHTFRIVKLLAKSSKIEKINVIGPYWTDEKISDKINFIKLPLYGKYFITTFIDFFIKGYKIILNNKLQGSTIVSTSPIFNGSLKVIYYFHSRNRHLMRNMKVNDFKSSVGYIFHYLYGFLDLYALKHAKKTLFVSHLTYQKISKEIRNLKNAYVLGNFVDSSVFFKIINNKEIEQIKNKYQLNNKEVTYFLYVGRLDYMKGVLQLCQCIQERTEEIESRIGKFEFVIIGDGVLKEEIAKYSFVHYLGSLSPREINHIYNICDIFLFPSLYENSPTVILEAKNVGIPIISMNVGDIPQMLEGYRCSIVNNICEFITEIIKLHRTQKYKYYQEKSEVDEIDILDSLQAIIG